MSAQQVVVINNVRYEVALRQDANWRRVVEYWNDKEYHKHPLENGDRLSLKTPGDNLSDPSAKNGKL